MRLENGMDEAQEGARRVRVREGCWDARSWQLRVCLISLSAVPKEMRRWLGCRTFQYISFAASKWL